MFKFLSKYIIVNHFKLILSKIKINAKGLSSYHLQILGNTTQNLLNSTISSEFFLLKLQKGLLYGLTCR